MKLVITERILFQIANGNADAAEILRHREEYDLELVAPVVAREHFEDYTRGLGEQGSPPPEGTGDLVSQVVTFLEPEEYKAGQAAGERFARATEHAPYVAVARVTGANGIWDDYAPPIVKYILPQYTTVDLIRKLATAKQVAFVGEVSEGGEVAAEEPAGEVPAVGPAPEETEAGETAPAPAAPPAEYYDFSLPFDPAGERAFTPLYVHRYLHFMGLECVSDGEVYYLQPVDPSKKALPDLSQLTPSAPVVNFHLDSDHRDEGYIDTEVEEPRADIPLREYWQVFLLQNDLGEYEYRYELGAFKDHFSLTIHWQDTPLKIRAPPRQRDPEAAPRLRTYAYGEDIAVTDLGFTEFGGDYRDLNRPDASRYFGADVTQLRPGANYLRLENRVFYTTTPKNYLHTVKAKRVRDEELY